MLKKVSLVFGGSLPADPDKDTRYLRPVGGGVVHQEVTTAGTLAVLPFGEDEKGTVYMVGLENETGGYALIAPFESVQEAKEHIELMEHYNVHYKSD